MKRGGGIEEKEEESQQRNVGMSVECCPMFSRLEFELGDGQEKMKRGR